jgi:hypothetical protein
VNRCARVCVPIFFTVLSIQPKQSASSTASLYATDDLRLALEWSTSQISFFREWFRVSHVRHAARVRTSRVSPTSTTARC